MPLLQPRPVPVASAPSKVWKDMPNGGLLHISLEVSTTYKAEITLFPLAKELDHSLRRLRLLDGSTRNSLFRHL